MTEERSGLPVLPPGWAWAELGQVTEILSGYGFPKKYQGDLEAEIPFYKVADISRAVLSGNPRLKDAENYVSQDVCEELRARPLPAGSVVFAKIGEAIRLNRRAILTQDSLVDNNVMGVYSFHEELTKLYIFYFLQTIKLGDYSRATTVPSVRKTDVAQIPAPLPPLSEQHRIVAKIEELFTQLDAGVAALEKAKAQLRRYRQAVLKAAVEGELTSEWREAHAQELQPVSIDADAEPPPQGWTWAKLGEICETTSGGTPSRKQPSYFDGDIPWLKSGELENGLVRCAEEFITEEGLNNSSAKIIPKDTLLIALYGATAGKVGILGIDAAINQAICAIFTPPEADTKYLFWFFRHYRDELLNARIGGAQPNLSQRILKKVQIPLPPLAEQRCIVAEVEQRLSVADEMEKAVEQSLKRAERLRQSILKRAFEGKLVPQDPSDEPASVLLERIKAEKARREGEGKGRKRSRKKKQTRQLELFTP
jgi:type I restriction enzyme S subunit